MGTKNNPGNYDCHANAHPDEPMFILLGRDKHAATLVRLWALLRHSDGEDEAKIEEALKCADAMNVWRRSTKGVNPVEEEAAFEPLLIAATEKMDEHPDNYDQPCACRECCTYQ